MTNPTINLTVEDGIENAYRAFTGGCYEFVEYVNGKKIIFEELTEDFDPMHPVVVSNHSTTTWARHCRITEGGYNWWIGIGHACTTNGTVTRAHLTEAFMQMLLLESCDGLYDRDVLDTMVYAYLRDEGIELDTSEWAQYLLKFNNVVSIFGDTAEMFAKEIVQTRLDALNHCTEDAARAIYHCGDGTDERIRELSQKYPDQKSVPVMAMMVYYQRLRNTEREAR